MPWTALFSGSRRAADVVVTMGCDEACRIYPGEHDEDWEVGDPEGLSIEQVRVIRDEIDRQVQLLLGSLLPEGATPAPHLVPSA